jgi:4-hydroxybenzoate polyprenyltransferase
MTLIREIVKDMEDMRGDQRFGAETLPILWGVRRTKQLLYGLIGFFIGVLYFLEPRLSKIEALYHLMMLPVLLHFAWTLHKADTKRDFDWLSAYAKWIMLAGVVGIGLMAL